MKFWAAPPSRWMTSSLSGNSGAAALDTRSTVGPRAWKQRRARWDRALPRVWAWPLPKSGSPRVTTSQILNCSATAFTHSGDGCMMEGISSEAASVAGHLKLDNLCWIYDNNHITNEGKTDITFTEDVAGRYLAY